MSMSTDRKLQNHKVILITALTRSGSNILWNIMQSHPTVCSPIGETNALLHPGTPGFHRVSRAVYRWCRTGSIERLVDRRLYKAKLDNIVHESNRYRAEDKPYTRDELESAVLCLKAVNKDIYLTELFYSMYEQIHTIGLVRNGYAICEGMVRRGINPERFGRDYAKYVGRMLDCSEKLKNYKIVRFENLVERPFETAESLYRFCDLLPTKVEKLRFKLKRGGVSRGNGTAGQEGIGDKYWVDRSSIRDFLDSGVDVAQATALAPADRRAFETQAKPILDYLGYA